jgi:hypothetical protein
LFLGCSPTALFAKMDLPLQNLHANCGFGQIAPKSSKCPSSGYPYQAQIPKSKIHYQRMFGDAPKFSGKIE